MYDTRRTPVLAGSGIAGIILAIALLLLPEIRFFSATLFNSTAGMKLLVGTVELLFVIAALLDRRVRPPALIELPPAARYLLLGWGCWSLVATLLATHPAPALVREAEWLAHGLFGVMLWRFLQAYPRWPAVLLGLIPLGFLLYMAFFAVFILASVPDPLTYPWASAIPGFDNIRHLGQFAMVALVFAAVPLTDAPVRYRSSKFWYALFAMTLAWGVLLWCGGRGPVIALLATTAGLLILRRLPAVKVLIPALLATAVAGTLLSLPLAMPGLGPERLFAAVFGAGGDYSSGRLGLWSDGLATVWRNPWFGIGPDGYPFDPISQGRYLHPHNLPLQVALAWGIPGGLLFLSLLLTSLWHAGGRLHTEDEYPGRALALWGLSAMLLVSLVSGVFYFPFSLLLAITAFAVVLQAPQVVTVHVTPASRSGYVLIAGFAGVLFMLHGLSLNTLLNPGIPRPDSARVGYLQAFPSALSHDGANDKLERWALRWWRRGEENAALQWLAWSRARTRMPWSSAIVQGVLLMESGRRQAGKALLAQAADELPPLLLHHLCVPGQEGKDDSPLPLTLWFARQQGCGKATATEAVEGR